MRRVVDRFPSGELQFDAFSRFGIRSQWMNSVVRRAGATLRWGSNGPEEIVAAVPGTRLLAWVSPFDTAEFKNIRGVYRALSWVMTRASGFRYMAQYHRYAF